MSHDIVLPSKPNSPQTIMSTAKSHNNNPSNPLQPQMDDNNTNSFNAYKPSSPSQSNSQSMKSNHNHIINNNINLIDISNSNSNSNNIDINNEILTINVGGEIFTTTTNTLSQSNAFNKLFNINKSSIINTINEEKTQKIQIKTQTQIATTTTTTTKRQTTFDDYCNEIYKKQNNNNNNNSKHNNNNNCKPMIGIYKINKKSYFVDRSPKYFSEILHFLRNYPNINADKFIRRYYTPKYMLCDFRRNSLSSNDANTNHNNNHNKNKTELLKLQDEAIFYQINLLVSKIQDILDEENRFNEMIQLPGPSHSNNSNSNINPGLNRLNTSSSNKSNKSNKSLKKNVDHDISWWDTSGPLKGIRRLIGTRIAFATSHDNWVDKDPSFDAPIGYKWATQAEYLNEYFDKRDILSKYKEWIHFGIGNWDNYRWKYARKVAFIFKDTFRGQRFVHSGMEVCDINHVKSLFGLMAESPMMEYDNDKGIIEGFAGLVLLSNDVYTGDNDANNNNGANNNNQPPSPFSILSSKEDKDDVDVDDNVNKLPLDDDPSTDWTDTDNEELLISNIKSNNIHNINDDKKSDDKAKPKLKLKPKPNPNPVISKAVIKPKPKSKEPQVLHPIQHTVPYPTATVPYPNGPPPLWANPYKEQTKKKRKELTKDNLIKHTQIENYKHTKQQLIQHQLTTIQQHIPQHQQQQQQLHRQHIKSQQQQQQQQQQQHRILHNNHHNNNNNNNNNQSSPKSVPPVNNTFKNQSSPTHIPTQILYKPHIRTQIQSPTSPTQQPYVLNMQYQHPQYIHHIQTLPTHPTHPPHPPPILFSPHQHQSHTLHQLPNISQPQLRQHLSVNSLPNNIKPHQHPHLMQQNSANLAPKT